MPDSFWTLRGRCLKLGHDVPHANGIVPLRLITARETDPAKITPHLFEQIAPKFAGECQPGDIVVAGRRFGMGPKVPGYIAMRALGLGLLCESMPVQAYRGAIGEGLRVLSPCPGVLDACETGDLLKVDFSTGEFTNQTRGLTRTFAPLPPELQELVMHGGTAGWLVEWAKANQPASAPHIA
jgi:3-isopropylmalate/(R)-2-methylmalate dehydratase small subunit